MTTHKQTMQVIFDELAKGNGRPLIEAMADDFTWTIAGHTAWSRSWRGKQNVLDNLLRPLNQRFATRYANRAIKMVAEGDTVVVECRGQVQTHGGKPYDNHYCFICRFNGDGRLVELTEYMDTAYAIDALGMPDPVTA